MITNRCQTTCDRDGQLDDSRKGVGIPGEATYAAELSGFDRDALLRTGAVVHLAPARAGDEGPIGDFYRRLDDPSSFSRFFGVRREIPFSELHELTTAPPQRCVAILAWIDGDVVGVGEFHATDRPGEAEVAFAVVAAHQHEGIATLLLEDLAVIAAAVGFRRLTAVSLPTNKAMQLVFRTAGLSEQHHLGDGEATHALELTTLDGLRTASMDRATVALQAAAGDEHHGGPRPCGSGVAPLR